MKTVRIAKWSGGVKSWESVLSFSRCNGLAVTESNGGYSVTHLASGRALNWFADLRLAMEALEVIAPIAPWEWSMRRLLRWAAMEGISEAMNDIVKSAPGGNPERLHPATDPEALAAFKAAGVRS